MSPRWGFRVGFTLFTIYISPRWGFKTRQCRFWKIDLLKFQVVSGTSGVG